MKSRSYATVLSLIVILTAAPSVLAQNPPTSAPDNDFIVRGSVTEIAGVLSRHGLTEVGRLDSPPPGEEVCLVRASASLPAEQVIAAVTSQEPSVIAFEEVFLASLPEADDTIFLDQAISEILGALGDSSTVLFDKDSTGTDRYVWTGYVEQAADNLVRASSARTLETGDGAVVAIIDSGIDPDHELFDGHLVPGYDFVLEQAGDASEWNLLDESTIAILGESTIAILGSEDAISLSESTIAILGDDQINQLDPNDIPDAFGHGTMVAGLVHLVAPAAKIMPLRAFDGDGRASVFDVIRAIYYAVDNGATVINMSFSLDIPSQELIAAIDFADQNGVTVVASVGNDGLESVVFPAGLCNVFGVASTDIGDYVSAFSNLGNDLVTLGAPGENVITAYPGGGWAGASGTSFAAPWVSGAVALLADAKGDGSAGSVGFTQIEDALSYADTIFGSGAGKCGDGRIDIRSALDNLSQLPATGGSGCSGSSNAFPSVTITAPVGGSIFTAGDNVAFTGTASDAEDGDLTTNLAWTSDLDGAIGTGGSFSTATLSAGTHTIIASATDSVLLTGSEAILLTLANSPPSSGGSGGSQGPTQGLALWAQNGAGAPRGSSWDGTSFGVAADTASVGEWRIMAGAAAPTRDEKIVVGIDGSELISGEMWDGTAWSALPFNTLATASVSYYWAFDVAYEPLSGDAVLVWNNGSSGSTGLSYRVWDGSAWSAETTIAAPLAGEPRHMVLAAHPAADEMVLVVNTSGGDDYALVWDGASWGDGQVLDSSTGDTDIDVAYEQQSGHAMVVYGKDSASTGFYRFWDGVSWSAEGTVPAPAGESLRPRWVTLGADPTSDRIAVGVLTAGDGSNSHTWLNVWTGSAWETASSATTAQQSSMIYPNVAVAFEATSGEALAVYQANNTATSVQYRTWTSGSGWSTEQTGPALGANANSVMLDADPAGNAIMLSAQASDDLHSVLWDGGAWGTPVLQGTATGEVKNQPFLFLWKPLGAPGTSQLVAAADTFLKKDKSDDNYGNASDLKLKADSNKIERALLRFDLSGIPTGTTLTSATLRLYVTSAKSGVTVNLHRSSRGWVEGTGNKSSGADWNHHDDPQAWATPGGDFTAQVLGSLVPDTAGVYHEVDVTALVQVWVDGYLPNDGLLLDPTGATDEVKIGSRENAGKEPLLKLTY